ncbi:uncharacterized protein FOMMEDRAFT_158556 [Fomitiporia mediterranea MF3/22]|uniref:uncharacterized protein n=1 Tax=Fomitiporia mediterranea (strain MF3/22) TaxID=694068 RepID=UPI0004407C22|nr:uncharacterized protein FOMMEDRAFT_158556 [Fomitiporia mediterranea MF3/22]EJD01415.1 hypothetical protein FOMMEDRAFT_158556 [Fomitiporia mediterranea MF3/22]
MTVCAGPAYPPPYSYHPPDGYMAHYINEVKEQVYSELQSQRASRLSSQKSHHSPHSRSPRYSGGKPTISEKKPRSSPWTSTPQITFPTPQITVLPTGPAFPIPQIFPNSNPYSPAWTPFSMPQPQIRFPTPEPYGPGTPVRSSLPMSYSPFPSATKPSPHRAYQAAAQVLPFPGSDESMPLLSHSSVGTYGSSRSSSASRSTQKRRINYDALVRAVENIKVCKREVAGWVRIIRQQRNEKLSKEERELVSYIEDIYQNASKALQIARTALHTVHNAHNVRHDAQFTSGKVTSDISTLSTFATSLRHKLGSLVRRLKELKASGPAERPGFFSCLEDAPGCLAGYYLKNRLFRFASLSKAHKKQYSELGSEAQSLTDHLPMTKLMNSLYEEVRRTYGIVSKTLAGFESSLHAFRLELERVTMAHGDR